MNIIVRKNKEYKLIGFWDTGFDSKGNKFTKPRESKEWTGKKDFVKKMIVTDLILEKMDKFKKYDEKKDCLLCGEKGITTGRFTHRRFMWEDGLVHYVDVHNFKPDESFMDLIYFYKPDSKVKIISDIKTDEHTSYIKINENQLMILDALLKHGGYSKKYIETTESNITRYSEHMGLLDFKMNLLEKIVVAGNTTRVDKGDNEIYLPKHIDKLHEYEYIFHTHPPTPRPGGRAIHGLIYEFPSMGDILHFIDSFNEGKLCGSLVITSEGLYNIRKIKRDHDKIIINEDKLFSEYKKRIDHIHDKAIEKYGTNFKTETFYSKISQDVSALNELNNILNKFDLHIDYSPRIKYKNMWILPKIYLPIF